eukprot:8221912-Pyramimonas_sp.AAC.1
MCILFQAASRLAAIIPEWPNACPHRLQAVFRDIRILPLQCLFALETASIDQRMFGSHQAYNLSLAGCCAEEVALFLPVPCHGMVFDPFKWAPQSRNCLPKETLGRASPFGVDSLIFWAAESLPLWGVPAPCYVMLRVDRQHHAMP